MKSNLKKIETKYKFILPSGETLQVTYDLNEKSLYTSYKLYIGDREIPIQKVLRLMNSDNVTIRTDGGNLAIPAIKL